MSGITCASFDRSTVLKVFFSHRSLYSLTAAFVNQDVFARFAGDEVVGFGVFVPEASYRFYFRALKL